MKKGLKTAGQSFLDLVPFTPKSTRVNQQNGRVSTQRDLHCRTAFLCILARGNNQENEAQALVFDAIINDCTVMVKLV
jgi:hypothetical protein